MATKKGGKKKGSYYRAKLVADVGTCVFCQRAVDDELIYGKLYAIGDIQCHYFCVLLSCCMVQKGRDDEGLFGFQYHDILAEVERSKKHRCSFCNREGANLGCCVTQCRKQFHLPCGRERNAMSLFYGNYKSFCASHAPKQKIVDSVMSNVRMRRIEENRRRQSKHSTIITSVDPASGDAKDTQTVLEIMCVICYEPVEGYPTPRTFWPPCCARDAWFHRSCLQRMALSAGMHYLKCPLCNDKENFYKAVVDQGYYVPDRDAAWELEQNAFAEIYERNITCNADVCKCPAGRDHDADTGLWDIKLCILCGSTGIHAGCTDNTEDNITIYVCKTCKPAAPSDLENLIASIEKVQLQEQAAETVRHGLIMPSRMSLRRTKQHPGNSVPCSSSTQNRGDTSTPDTKSRIERSRLELNLKTPARRIFEPAVTIIDNILISPIKMLEQGLSEKMEHLRSDVVVDSSKVLDKLKEKFKKPRPLVAKKKIIKNILDELFSSILKDPKSKEALKEWNSPKKICEIKMDDSKEIHGEVIKPANSSPQERSSHDKNYSVKSSPVKKNVLQFTDVNDLRETCETDEFNCHFSHKHTEMSSNVNKLHTAIDFAMDAYKSSKRKLPNEDAVPKKKRKSKLKFKTNNSIANIIEEDIKQTEANLDSSKVRKTENNLIEIKNENIVKSDIDQCRIEDDGSKAVPEEQGSIIYCNMNKESVDISHEKSTDSEIDNIHFGVTKTNPAKDIDKFKKEFVNGITIEEEDDDEVDKRKIVQDKSEKVVHNRRKKNKNVEGNDNLTKKKYDRRDRGKCYNKISLNNLQSDEKVIDFSRRSSNKKLKSNYKKKPKRELSVQNKEIKVKIRWKKKNFKLKITEKKEKRRRSKTTPKVLKQYLLKYTQEVTSPKDTIIKPDGDVNTPVKRKYVKTEKYTDNMVQTNISNYFKAAPKL